MAGENLDSFTIKLVHFIRRVMSLACHTTGLESVTHEVSFVPVFVRD